MTHDELRKLAEAATPGPWATDYNPTASPNLWIVAPAAEAPSLCKFETWDLGDGRKGQLHEQDWKDAAYIAAANPKTVLELLDRIAELEGALIPSESTRAAYMGRFYFNFPTRDFRGNEITLQPNIPWITIREIMAAIMVYASKGAKP